MKVEDRTVVRSFLDLITDAPDVKIGEDISIQGHVLSGQLLLGIVEESFVELEPRMPLIRAEVQAYLMAGESVGEPILDAIEGEIRAIVNEAFGERGGGLLKAAVLENLDSKSPVDPGTYEDGIPRPGSEHTVWLAFGDEVQQVVLRKIINHPEVPESVRAYLAGYFNQTPNIPPEVREDLEKMKTALDYYLLVTAIVSYVADKLENARHERLKAGRQGLG